MNHQEIEVKFLDIDVSSIENKLKEIGAVKVGEYLYHMCVFDHDGFPLDKDFSLLRLRDEGDKVMLAFKKRLGVTSENGNDSGMEEIQVEVSDYEKTKLLLLKSGMIIKFEQEKKRTRYTKNDVEFDIDTWPQLKPYLEIEAQREEDLISYAEELGLNFSDAKRFSASQVYALSGIRDKDYIKMTFEEFVKR